MAEGGGVIGVIYIYIYIWDGCHSKLTNARQDKTSTRPYKTRQSQDKIKQAHDKKSWQRKGKLGYRIYAEAA